MLFFNILYKKKLDLLKNILIAADVAQQLMAVCLKH